MLLQIHARILYSLVSLKTKEKRGYKKLIKLGILNEVMKKYKVFTTEGFDKEKGKLTKEEEKRVEKIFLQLKDNPYVGDQLRYRFLREKRIKEKRIYYLV